MAFTDPYIPRVTSGTFERATLFSVASPGAEKAKEGGRAVVDPEFTPPPVRPTTDKANPGYTSAPGRRYGMPPWSAAGRLA